MEYIKINNDTQNLLENKIIDDFKNNKININDIFFNLNKIISSFLNGKGDLEKIDLTKRRIITAKVLTRLFRKDIFFNMDSKCFLKIRFNILCENDSNNLSFWILKSEHVLRYESINFPIVLLNNLYMSYCPTNQTSKELENIKIIYFQNNEEYNEPLSNILYDDTSKELILQKLIVCYECMQYNFYATNPIYQIINSNIDIKKIVKIRDVFLNINFKKLIILSPTTIFIKNTLFKFNDYVNVFLNYIEREEINYNNENFFEIIFKSFSDRINFTNYPFRIQPSNFDLCTKIYLKEGYVFKYENSIVCLLNKNDIFMELAVLNENTDRKFMTILTKYIVRIDEVQDKLFKLNELYYKNDDYIKIY